MREWTLEMNPEAAFVRMLIASRLTFNNLFAVLEASTLKDPNDRP